MKVSEPVKDILEVIVKKENIKEYDLVIHDGNKKGEGFLGELMFLDVKDKNSDKILNLVFKKAFTQEKLRESVPIRQSFMNEIYFYEDVYPTLDTLQNDYNIANTFTNIPKCYYSTSEENNEYLVMENLKSKGFVLFDKTKLFDMSHIDLIFKTYGRFHGISFALSRKNPEKFKEIEEKSVNVFNIFGDTDHFKGSISAIVKAIFEKLKPGEDDKLIKAFEIYLEKGHDIFLKGVNYKGKYNTINHGDCWSNNMMFKYNADGKLIDLTVIDWQLIKVGSPVHDLVYCLYTGSGKDVYDQLEKIQKIYYESLTETLKEFELDVSEIYPFEALQEDWKIGSRFAMVFAFMICRMKLTHQEDVMDLNDFEKIENSEDGQKMMFNMRVADSYDVMMKDLITHMYDNNML